VVALYKKEEQEQDQQLITHNTKNIPLILFFCSLDNSIQFNSIPGITYCFFFLSSKPKQTRQKHTPWCGKRLLMICNGVVV
jgi:hypothetical protein